VIQSWPKGVCVSRPAGKRGFSGEGHVIDLSEEYKFTCVPRLVRAEKKGFWRARCTFQSSPWWFIDYCRHHCTSFFKFFILFYCNTTYKDIQYTTLLTLLTLLITQYYITFSFPFTHTERNGKEKKQKRKKLLTTFVL